jgi:hypothetical protein
MALYKKVLILECVPLKDERNEGVILNEFMQLIYEDKVDLERIKSKNDLIERLKNNKYKYIHISGHGECDEYGECYLETPHGFLTPDEFDEKSGFNNRICFISACSLGKKGFAETFWANAKPDILIAPQREITYVDAATFWILLYYNHFYLKKTLAASYRIAKESVKSSGAMQYWYEEGYGDY